MLPKNLKLVMLKMEHLAQIIDLHKKTCALLHKQGHGLFVLPKTKEDFVNFLTNHFMFGVIDKQTEQLVGQVVCYLPQECEDFYDNYLNFGQIKKTQMFHIKTLEVAEDYWGKELGVHLFTACSKAALDNGRRYSVSDVAFENWQSIRSFDKTGHLISHIIQPTEKVTVNGVEVDDIPLVIMIQDVKEPFCFNSSNNKHCDFSLNQFEDLADFIEKGLFARVNKIHGKKEFVLSNVPELSKLLKLYKAA